MNHSENVRVKKAKERSRHITSNTYFSTYIICKVICFRLLKTALFFVQISRALHRKKLL